MYPDSIVCRKEKENPKMNSKPKNLFLIFLVFLPVFSWISLFSPCGFAQNRPNMKEDFAKGLFLIPVADTPVCTLEIPDTVYRTVTRGDLGDIRIFNKEARVVPHAFRYPETREKENKRVSVPVFPVHGKISDAKDGFSMQVKTDENGAIVDIRSDQETGSYAIIHYYLLDMTEIQGSPRALSFFWKKGEKGFAEVLSISQSSDLVHWNPLHQQASIAELYFGGHHLIRKRFPLPGKTENYLRIYWPKTLENVRLVRVEAELSGGIRKPEHKSARIRPVAVSGASGSFLYDTGGKFPVNLLRLVMPEKNMAKKARILSSDQKDKGFIPLANQVFYTIVIEGKTYETEPVRINQTSRRYYKVILPGDTPESLAPDLEIQWVPHEVFFLAQGQGPYLLAFGSAGILPPETGIRWLLRDFDKNRKGLIGKVKTGKQVPLGGEKRLHPPKKAVNWKKWAVFLVLIFGVLLLGWAAFTLYRQIEEKEKAPPSDPQE